VTRYLLASRAIVIVIASVTFATFATGAAAGEPPTAAQREEGKRLFTEAHDHIAAGRCRLALPLLDKSNRVLPSPNTGLLIARCLVDLGRPVEAAARYAEVEREATLAVQDGEAKYAETSSAAAKEGAELRRTLGTLRVRSVPRGSVVLEVDGRSVPLSPEGDASVLHVPGDARIAFVHGDRRRERVVHIDAGGEIIVTYEADAAGPRPAGSGTGSGTGSDSGSRRDSRAAVPWIAYGTGGLALAGLGTFAGFGLASESKYGDLEKCAPRCGASERDTADTGRTFQTVANVGLLVGLAFAVATTVILILDRP
jgi:hypothetical protein